MPNSRAETPLVGLSAGGDPAERLVELVGHQHTGSHGIGDPECLADVLLGLTNQRAHQGTDVENERGSADFVAQRLGDG